MARCRSCKQPGDMECNDCEHAICEKHAYWVNVAYDSYSGGWEADAVVCGPCNRKRQAEGHPVGYRTQEDAERASYEAAREQEQCWERDVEVDGQPVTYRAHAASDPETVALMDELVRAVYRHMTQTRKVQ